MEYPIIHQGEEVGTCTLTRQGLYWFLDCSCRVLSDRIERLYTGTGRLGILEREGDRLTLHRRISVSSAPELPPKSGHFTLEPQEEMWCGDIEGIPCRGQVRGEHLVFPYDPHKPCPCEPLICFFTVADGYWQLPIHGPWEIKEQTPK